MDWKVRVVRAFAEQITPGWKANALAASLRVPLKLIKPRAQVAIQNIDIVFPDLSRKEKKKILSESYENIIWTGVETMATQRDPEVWRKWVLEVDGERHFTGARAAGKGVIALAAHIGNWELGASALSACAPVTSIVRNSDNPFYCELVAVMRKRIGIKTMDKREPMIRGISVLRRNEVFGIMSDQHGGREGIMAPFFGVKTSTHPGPAVFAYLTGASIVPLQIIRLEPFKFKVVFDPPLQWEKLGDRDSTILDITTKANRSIENMIRRAPGQWLWQHRRFREISREGCRDA